MKNFTRLTFFGFFYTLFSAAFAQGSWFPNGADLSFPRTVFKASEIPGVRQSLQDPERKTLYTGVYNSAFANQPSATSTDDADRRERARIAKSAAFVRILNLNPLTTTLDSLTIPEKAQLDTIAINLLKNLNPAVETFTDYDKWQWRSKELIDYLIAYDLLRGAKIPESSLLTCKTKLQQFAGNLYQQGYLYVGFINNNHLFMTAAALGTAGIVLNDMTSSNTNQQPQKWITIGMYNIDNAMWRNSSRQSDSTTVAGYAEGPYYFKYAMLNCLPFFKTFGNFLPDAWYSFTWNSTRHSIRNPYFDPKYDLLYQWITQITMPDGRLPALEDSYIDMAMPELALTGKPQFVKNFYPQNLSFPQQNSLNSQLYGTVDMRANYLAANLNPQPETDKTLTSLPASGNLIFRSGTGFKSNYLHVYGKNGKSLTNSGGHNQGDAGSFSLYAFGQLLALDAGYLSYDRRTELGNATNHNLVLVDGLGPKIGTSGSANDAAAYIQNAFETPALSYGEVKTTYNGADILRKTLSVRGEYYLISDFISATAAHNFTWQLHGFGLENGTTDQGIFTDNLINGEGTWQKNGVSLRATVTATDGASSYNKTTSFHETTYNIAESHTTFLAQKDNVLQTQFLASLTPFEQNAPVTTTTLSQANIAGIVNNSNIYTDLIFTQSDTVLQTVNAAALPLPVKSDASFTLYSLDKNNEFAQLFLQNGTVLHSGTDILLKSSKRANITWAQINPNEFHGYVNKPAILEVKLENQPITVSGQNLTGWSYNAATQTLQASFSQPSDFEFKVSQSPLPVELVAFKAEKVNSKVKLNWQTASEKNNRQFIIERSFNAGTWKAIGSIAGQGTKNTFTAYEYSDTPDFSGTIYYRLLQQDFDGKVVYSKIEKVAFSESKNMVLQVYPNPAADLLTLKLETQEPELAEIRIFNTAGTEVYKLTNQEIKNGTEINLKVEGLPAGFYILSLQTNGLKQQVKFLKKQ